ncbi:predicted protein [Lichtheimia corymbifera JMRC:FSU:9682]|uniref:Uncharacterized protein n=1 Tax=Lichtheimia corymbifera JMRC:FSU:9682 TaxID=1263082 RepID=A0A068SDT6_9FUNG|nr:predicted protein [Lichtheimia corymbifera JMRC:FSU:9682]
MANIPSQADLPGFTDTMETGLTESQRAKELNKILVSYLVTGCSQCTPLGLPVPVDKQVSVKSGTTKLTYFGQKKEKYGQHEGIAGRSNALRAKGGGCQGNGSNFSLVAMLLNLTLKPPIQV